MKHLTLALMGIAALSLASCSSDEPAPAAVNGGDVTFSVKMPMTASQSRAFSDGQLATNLTYAVYLNENGTYTLADTDTPVTSATQWTVQSDGTIDTKVPITLTRGSKYRIIFYAANPGQQFTTATFSANGATLNCDYTKVTDNNEIYDAFYQYIDVDVTPSYQGDNVVLYRPFAQLNVGTNDINKTVVQKSYANGVNTKVKVSNVSNQMDLLNNVIAPATATQLTFGPVTPATSEAFPVVETPAYTWLAMNYLLVSKETTTVDLEFLNGTTSVNTISVPNVPLERNYQTNIFGQLLSTTANYNVKIQPAFQGVNNGPFGDYGFVQQPSNLDVTNKTVSITTAGELRWLAAVVNGAVKVQDVPATMTGFTVNLEADIDLNNEEWIPIGQSYYADGMDWNGVNQFRGTFNGNNHTVSNITITKPYHGIGFFGLAGNGFLCKDLTLANVNISAEGTPCGVAAMVGDLYSNGIVQNCTVRGGTIKGAQWVGGIGGYVQNAKFLNNTVEDLTISAVPYKNADGIYVSGDKSGGIAGYVNPNAYGYDTQMTGNNVYRLTLSAYRDCGDLAGGSYISFSNGIIDGVTRNVINIPAGESYEDNKPAGDNFNLGIGRPLGDAGVSNYDFRNIQLF